jgi:hypothetical protein
MIAPLALAFVAIVAGPRDTEPTVFTAPLDPFKISGNLYYVGSRDLAAYLVVTPEGNILINATSRRRPRRFATASSSSAFTGPIRRFCSTAKHTTITPPAQPTCSARPTMAAARATS